MLRISLQTLRARRGTLTGAFVAILLAVTLASATGLLMAGALGAPGAGRFAAADAVVRADPTVTIGHGEDAEGLDAIPGPRLPGATAERVAAVPGVARAVADVTFPAGAWDARGHKLAAEDADRLFGHGWASAALTPYDLTAGRAPRKPAEVVADSRLGARPGDVIRVVTSAGERAPPRQRDRRRRAAPATPARRRCSSPTPSPGGWPAGRGASTRSA